MRDYLPPVALACALVIGIEVGEAAINPIAVPSIAVNPTSRFVMIGSSVTFFVLAQGGETLSYQWFKNGLPLAGETNSQIVITNVQITNRGFYHALVRNPAAAVASRLAFLVPQSILPANSGGAVRFSTVPNAPVTNFYFGTRLTGDQWAAQLYAGPAGTPESELSPIGLPEPFGALSGFVMGGTNYISSVAPGGQAVIQMRVWSPHDGDTYEQAVANRGLNGRSGLIVATTGGSSNPVTLAGMPGFSIFWLDPQRVIKTPQNHQEAVGGEASFSAEMYTCCLPGEQPGTNSLPYEWRRNGILIPDSTTASLVLTNIDVADAATYTFTTGGIRSPSYSLSVLLNPRILALRCPSPHEAQLAIRSGTASIISVDASSNLVDWTTIATLTNQSGMVEYIDSSSPAPPKRFYRATNQ